VATDIEAIIDRFRADKGQLVSILQDIQDEYYYLPKDALEKVSQILDIPLSQVYSIATFFRAFSLTPRGRHLIKVCLGTACHVRGAPRVLEKMERDLEIGRGGTTDDLKFTLETVNCVGACALGPMVIVDDEYSGQMKTDKIEALLNQYE
jgi:NADH-quinone oxidoreductase subunit E